MKLAAIGIVFLAGLGAFVWLGIDTVPVVEAKDLLAWGRSGSCQVDDAIVQSVERVGDVVRFKVFGEKASSVLLDCETRRNPPENFRPSMKINMKGTYDSARKVLLADEIMTKCTSRYEAAGRNGPPPDAFETSKK
jgi:hypothetical protein